MHISTMHSSLHTAIARVVEHSLRKGGVEHVVSRLHILILLLNLSFAFTLILVS